ncbi:hypothetical protein [Agromyces sp. NPDC058064]|uniref:hypothetical protein n=1 Tax=Agromyces sp. NPDC058064 TaxID=3346322 RepID=UPI0036D8563B
MTEQLTRDDLKGMTPAQIVAAQDAGQLNDVLGIPAPHEPGPILTREDVRKLYEERRFDEITTAQAEGRINYDERNAE